ncbi:MAG: type IV pili methyl-accepting chemotaxis transducer N-terminal domain-containing protein [Pseudomonadota bacterium]
MFHTPVLPVSAVAADQMDHSARINLAGRQRMLTQRMAKAVCFFMAGIEPGRQSDMAWLAENEFRTALGTLRDGEPTLGIGPATEPEVLAQLQEIDEMFQTYGAAVQQLIHGDWHTIVVAQLLALNPEVLAASHEAVQLMQASAGDNGKDPAFAKTVNVAGRQRMLSQLMSKTFCFVKLGIDVAAQRERLEKAMSDFDTALKDLQTGSAALGLIEPPNSLARSQLERVAQTWAEFRAPLDRAVRGDPITPDDIAIIAGLNERLLSESNTVVKMYVPAR